MLDFFPIISTIFWTIWPFALCLFLGYLIGAVFMERRRKNDLKLIRDKLTKVTQYLEPIEDALEISRSTGGDQVRGGTAYNPVKESFIQRLINRFRPTPKKTITDLPESRTKDVEDEVIAIADRLKVVGTVVKAQLKENEDTGGNASHSHVNREKDAEKKMGLPILGVIPAVPGYIDPWQQPRGQEGGGAAGEGPGGPEGRGPEGHGPDGQVPGGSEGHGDQQSGPFSSVETPPSFSGLLEEIAYSYNLGVDSKEARNSFWENYHTVRIGNNKAIEQRLGEVAEPEFRSLDSGNFIAIEDAGNHRYLVVPQFDMTLTASAFNEGGVGYIFDCPEYDPEVTYRVVKVVRPAVFNSDGRGNWSRVTEGKLSLQR